MLKAFTRNYEDNSTEAGFSSLLIVTYAMMGTRVHSLNPKLTRKALYCVEYQAVPG